MRTAPSPCTHCGEMLDEASAVTEVGRWPHNKQRRFTMTDDERPTPGCASVCIRCGHLMIFDEQLRLRDLTPAEQIEIAGNPILLAIQDARGKTMKAHGGNCEHGIPRGLCRECSTRKPDSKRVGDYVIRLPDLSKRP